MGYYAVSIISSLKHAGYNVTYLADGAVTIDYLLTGMKNYSVVIWRTDSFTMKKNATYWYISDKPTASELKYASALSPSQVTTGNGMIAASTDFLANHFGRNSMQGVKLMMLVASNSNRIAPIFTNAGVDSVIFCSVAITLQFGLVDDLTAQLVGFLIRGESVYNAVYDTLSPLNEGEPPRDPLDSTLAVIFWYLGDGSVNIAPLHTTPALRKEPSP